MKKKKIGLCAVALLCMSGTAKAALPALKQDNTKVVNHAQITAAYKTNRPAVKNRLYTSQAVEAEILRVKKLLTNAKLAWMFENCFPNTLDTTVHYRLLNGKPDTFVYSSSKVHLPFTNRWKCLYTCCHLIFLRSASPLK